MTKCVMHCKGSSMMKTKLFSCLVCLLIVFGVQLSIANAEPLSKKEANKILQDTYLIFEYLKFTGEPSYKNPANIIKAALFGAHEVRHSFDFKQEEAQEAGKKLLPESTALFKIQNQAFVAKDVVFRSNNASLFKGLPEEYNVFVSRKACELAALRFTGHSIKLHMAPDQDTKLTAKGYFISIEGLGDILSEAHLKKINETQNGYILSGVIESEQEESGKKKHFTLELTRGEVPGTWLRTYSEK